MTSNIGGISGWEIAKQILPHPKRVDRLEGSFTIDGKGQVYADRSVSPVEREAALRFAELYTLKSGIVLKLATDSKTSEQGRISLSVTHRDGLSDRERQGYELAITPEEVHVVGFSDCGLYYGLQTLTQLLLAFGPQWPCMEIYDTPDFAVRGLSFDVSRGKVPTLATLQELVDHLSLMKINHLQLYVEHTYDFSFNRNIAKDCTPLTAGEIRSMDAYCASRRVDLVPSLASFGHMGAILSLPEYRHLAEIETTKSWSEMTWRERMHGLTLDASNPTSRELIKEMYDEYLPLFSSRFVNVCGDETYDLAKGKSREYAEKVGVGQLYVEHIAFLRDLCADHGKKIIFWGDMIKKYPDLISRIPRDATVAHWDYLADADYRATETFCESGLSTYVCPGTSAWNRIICDINTADLNIRRFAEAGKKHGATGLLNTDWGDDGHVNLQASAWHPICLGAAMAWHVGKPDAETFDATFSRLFFGDDGGKLIRAYRELVRTSDIPRTWPEFYLPLEGTPPETQVDDAYLATWKETSLAAAHEFANHESVGICRHEDVTEMEIACRINAMVADRMFLARKLADQEVREKEGSMLARQLNVFADACDEITPRYRDAWLARNKSACLHEILRVFERLAEQARAAAKNLPGKT